MKTEYGEVEWISNDLAVMGTYTWLLLTYISMYTYLLIYVEGMFLLMTKIWCSVLWYVVFFDIFKNVV